MHQHRINGPFSDGEATGQIEGTVSSVDLGIVADFRYVRIAVPFEGQSRKLSTSGAAGSFSLEEVVENRTLRLDVPLLVLRDFAKEPTGARYPGSIRRRTTLELWVSGSVGMAPIQPVTATAGLTYYRYGVAAVKLFAGGSLTPFEGLAREIDDGREINRRVQGYGPGIVFGIEVTLAAGEYGLELFQFILDADRSARDWTRR